MLAHRVIPVILCRGRTLVKGKRFDSWRSVGVAAQAARIHAMRGVDEICLLDIGATPEGRGPDLALVEELSEAMFCPLTVGGGVRGVHDVKALLRAGADKVVIKTAGWMAIKEAAEVVGSQAIVAAVDVRGEVGWSRPKYLRPTHPIASEAWWLEKCGAGEILLTRVEREGMMNGYDLDLIRAVSGHVSIPVIAHGGCGSYEHMRQAITAGASAVAAGAFFQFEEATPKEAAKFLAAHGIEARL